MKKFLSICSFFVSFYFMCDFAAKIFPVNEVENTMKAPVWYIFLLLLVPFFVARIIWKGSVKKAFKFKADPIVLTCSNEPFKVPSSKKERNDLASKLWIDTKTEKELSIKADSVSGFIYWYNSMLVSAEKLSKLNGKVSNINRDLEIYYQILEDGFQNELCDAINRIGDSIVEAKKNDLKYEQELVKQRILDYKRDLDNINPHINQATKDRIRIKYNYVCHECGMAYLSDVVQPEIEHFEKINGLNSIELELKKIDLMEGHDFENWCATLLKKCGYENVNVTPGSGDQGVDILAQKSGIKYAIQCKCYSSDLGNKPVQEVSTGKIIYHCHVGVVMTNRYFTPGAHQAADATGTLLWDRDAIIKMLKSITKEG